MKIKKSTFFILLLFYTFNSTAQSIYSLLTAHDGYWLLYSERIEQCQDGDCIAKETFANDEMHDAIMFDEDGILYTVSTMNNFSQSESKWKLKDEDIITLVDESRAVQMEIIEISTSRLVLKYSEERPGGLSMAKISTYCFPDIRLSEEDAEALNERGVFEIDTPTVRSGDIVKTSHDSPVNVVSEDLDKYRIFQPSENSKEAAQLFIFNSFSNLMLLFPFEVMRLFPSIQWEGIKDLTVYVEEKERMKFHCDKKGNILYMDIEDEEKVIWFEYKDNVPASINSDDNEIQCYTGENFFLTESRDKKIQILYETNEQSELIKRRVWKNLDTLDFTGEFFDNTTKEGFCRLSLDDGEMTQEYSFYYTNDGVFPFEIKYTENTRYAASDEYKINKTGNVMSIKAYDIVFDGEEEKLEFTHEYRFHLNEKENIQKIEALKDGGRVDSISFEYSYY